jgi:hypothetical protein
MAIVAYAGQFLLLAFVIYVIIKSNFYVHNCILFWNILFYENIQQNILLYFRMHVLKKISSNRIWIQAEGRKEILMAVDFWNSQIFVEKAH